MGKFNDLSIQIQENKEVTIGRQEALRTILEPSIEQGVLLDLGSIVGHFYDE